MITDLIYSRTDGYEIHDRARTAGLARLAHCLERRRSEKK